MTKNEKHKQQTCIYIWFNGKRLSLTPLNKCLNCLLKCGWCIQENFSQILINYLISGSNVGCRSNSECPAKQACQNKKCVNPCTVGECGATQNCEVANHRAQCVDGKS